MWNACTILKKIKKKRIAKYWCAKRIPTTYLGLAYLLKRYIHKIYLNCLQYYDFVTVGPISKGKNLIKKTSANNQHIPTYPDKQAAADFCLKSVYR